MFENLQNPAKQAGEQNSANNYGNLSQAQEKEPEDIFAATDKSNNLVKPSPQSPPPPSNIPLANDKSQVDNASSNLPPYNNQPDSSGKNYFIIGLVSLIILLLIAIFWVGYAKFLKQPNEEPSMSTNEQSANLNKKDIKNSKKINKKVDVNLDSDKDGVPDVVERFLGTDKNNSDTDGDGLLDSEEIKKYHTNPLKADSDGDGISDFDEIKNDTNPNCNEKKLNDKCKKAIQAKQDKEKIDIKRDSDKDGLPDVVENFFKTDPKKADTDGDGLKDGEEILKYKTNPLNPDTDGDGLKDGEEILKYKTNPLNPDTDGDGYNDGKEVSNGYNPLGDGKLK